MEHPPFPLERLIFFRKELGISPQALEPLRPYADSLADRAEAMATSLYQHMGKMAQTKIILDHETSPERLQSNWVEWYATLWKNPCDDALLASLWHSGLRHVTHGVDHRFITLAYSLVRGFSLSAVRELVPPQEREQALILADKLFDLCILVESDAYIAARAHCSNDVMMGIAHQLRNPLTVIGGQVSRLLKNDAASSEAHSSLEAVLDEARRIERMMRDLAAYIGILRKEAKFESLSLGQHVAQALAELRAASPRPFEATVRLAADQEQDTVQVDPTMLRDLLFHILQNALEAQEDVPEPSLLLRSVPGPHAENGSLGEGHFLTFEICNPAPQPEAARLEDFFQPFHSTKAYGTGLGLAIAKLCAQKNFGVVHLRPWKDKGLCCRVTLVKSGHVHQSGLFFSSPEKENDRPRG